MTANARYVHTNLVARDWKKLARFYVQVLNCEQIPAERDLSGNWLDRAVALNGARILGAHLRLPGWGENGPTLEIFQYTPEEKSFPAVVNRPGFGHIAFAVDDVEETLVAVLAAGGGTVGEMVTVPIPDAGTIQFVYCTDPEGNIIELQRWLP